MMAILTRYPYLSPWHPPSPSALPQPLAPPRARAHHCPQKAAVKVVATRARISYVDVPEATEKKWREEVERLGFRRRGTGREGHITRAREAHTPTLVKSIPPYCTGRLRTKRGGRGRAREGGCGGNIAACTNAATTQGWYVLAHPRFCDQRDCGPAQALCQRDKGLQLLQHLRSQMCGYTCGWGLRP